VLIIEGEHVDRFRERPKADPWGDCWSSDIPARSRMPARPRAIEPRTQAEPW